MASGSNKKRSSVLIAPQATAPNSGSNGELYNNTTRGLQVMRRGAWQTVATADNPCARFEDSATSISGSLATIVWTTANFDTHNAMDSSGNWTAPHTGYYQVNCHFAFGGTYALNNLLQVRIDINGSFYSAVLKYVAGATTNEEIGIHDIIPLNAGDTLRIQVSNGGTTPTIETGGNETYLSIAKVGGPLTA